MFPFLDRSEDLILLKGFAIAMAPVYSTNPPQDLPTEDTIEVLLEIWTTIPILAPVMETFWTDLSVRWLAILKLPKNQSAMVDAIAYRWDKLASECLQSCCLVLAGAPVAQSQKWTQFEPSSGLALLIQRAPETIQAIIPSYIAETVSKLPDENIEALVSNLLKGLLTEDWAKLILSVLEGLCRAKCYHFLSNFTSKACLISIRRILNETESHGVLMICKRLLLGYTHSPKAFHSLLPELRTAFENLVEKASSEHCFSRILFEFCKFLHVLLFIHPGFPELYSGLSVCLRKIGISPPEASEVRKLVSENSWRVSSQIDWIKYETKSTELRQEGFPTGLENLGNTCFINSVLQSLYFSSFFLEDFKKAPVSKNSLFQALKAVFAELAQSKQRYHSPSKLIDLKNTSLFPKGSQGDSAEFFKYVLDAYCTTIKNEDIPFSGKIETSIRCLHCNYESHSDERFVELSLPFPDADEKSSGLSIETLLDSYFLEPVRLSGDSMYFCSSCNVKREASSQTKLKILPMHLAICLKRFMFDKETLSRSKILTVRSL